MLFMFNLLGSSKMNIYQPAPPPPKKNTNKQACQKAGVCQLEGGKSSCEVVFITFLSCSPKFLWQNSGDVINHKQLTDTICVSSILRSDQNFTLRNSISP